jgi:hypothetical protein
MKGIPSVPITGLVGGDSDALYVTLPLMQSIFLRSELNEGERLLWLWMVIHCALAQSTSCEFSYLDLSNMMHWKIDAIHRADAKKKENEQKDSPDTRRASEFDFKCIGGGCGEYLSENLFNPTPSCYGIPWTEMLRCILDMLKTDNVWSG